MKVEHYAALADLEEYHWWHISRQSIIPDFLRREMAAVGLQPGACRMLDVGCGTGKMVRLLGNLADVTGIEMSPEALAFCRSKGVTNIAQADAEHLPFEDQSFDLISAQEVLEHTPDDMPVLQECRRVLRPGGLLFATVPAYQWMWGPADVFANHFRRYTRRQLNERCQTAGFEVRRSSYFNFWLFPAASAVRLARKPFVDLSRLNTEDLVEGFDFYIGPRFLNGVLARIFTSEGALLRRVNLPFGVSIIASYVKPR